MSNRMSIPEDNRRLLSESDICGWGGFMIKVRAGLMLCPTQARGDRTLKGDWYMWMQNGKDQAYKSGWVQKKRRVRCGKGGDSTWVLWCYWIVKRCHPKVNRCPNNLTGYEKNRRLKTHLGKYEKSLDHDWDLCQASQSRVWKGLRGGSHTISGTCEKKVCGGAGVEAFGRDF